MSDGHHHASIRWTGWGALFGVCFPLLALAIRSYQLGLPAALQAFASDPLLWIIATAPVFLGLFALLGGVQQDRVKALSNGLEQTVAERTASLSTLLQRVQTITDGIGDGVVTVDLAGQVQHASGVAEGFLGPVDGRPVWDWIFPDEETPRAFLEMGLNDIAEDLMPFEVLVDQMPHRAVQGERTLHIQYRRVDGEGGAPCILLVLQDVTAALAAERAQRESQELQAVFTQILRDGQAWQRFRSETDGLIEAACTASATPERMRALHTLKGNAAIFGLARFAEVCHELEEQLDAPLEDAIDSVLPERLNDTWKSCQNAVSQLLPQVPDDEVRIALRELQALEDDASRGLDPALLVQRIRALRQPRIGAALQRLAGEAERLAGRLGKSIQVHLEGSEVRLAEATIATLGPCLVHAVRNAIDHGIELPGIRTKRGKPTVGHLKLSAYRDGSETSVSIEDDGEGIDVRALVAAAKRRELPIPADPLQLIFADGVSSREVATDISGRGVGMAALRQACLALGGDVQVQTASGKGTRLTLRLRTLEVGAGSATGTAPSETVPIGQVG